MNLGRAAVNRAVIHLLDPLTGDAVMTTIYIAMSSLKILRQQAFLSQRELAAKAGVSFRTVQRLEWGVHSPRGRTVRKIAKALGVRPQDIDW